MVRRATGNAKGWLVGCGPVLCMPRAARGRRGLLGMGIAQHGTAWHGIKHGSLHNMACLPWHYTTG